jgi:hypothetical protein
VRFLALAATPASAEITLVNAGFETGNTAGWNGTGTAMQAYAGYTAAAGSYFAVVRSPGCPEETLAQRFTADAGDVLTGWAFFSTTEVVRWNDDGAVRVVVEKTATDTIVFSSSVADVGDLGSSPWTRLSYAFQAPAHTTCSCA